MKALAAISFALALALPAHAATTLDASVDHDVVHPGETIELRLRQAGDGPAVPPDLSPLHGQFDVLDTSQSRRISITNGLRESSTDWVVTIAPRTTGAVTIPGLTAGDAVSEPIALQVVEATASAGDTQKPDLFVEASVDQTAPFVQGEVRYTVKVYDAVGIHDGALTEPTADGLGVRALGEGRAYDEMVGGRRYRVHEREYALVPQASGDVVVPPVTLEATVPDARGGGRGARSGRGSLFEEFFGDDPFGDGVLDRFFDRGRQVRVRSNPVTLAVQARPDTAGDGWFLPAQRVQLSREWGTTPPTFRVGEPIDQTIVLQALGSSAEQLPAIELPPLDGIKQYADAPETRTIPTGGGTVAERRQTWSLIPTKPGTLTLPAIEVKWFDVEAREPRIATLAAETIEVLPAVGATAQTELAPVVPATPKSAAPVTAAPSAPTTNSGTTFPWWLVASAAVLLGAGMAWLIAYRRRSTGPSPATTAPSTRALSSAIEDACRRNDARAARAALLTWGQQTWSDTPPATLGEIARRMASPELSDAVARLDASLYGRETSAWDGDALWRAFQTSVRARRSGDDDAREVLPGLYPRDRAA